jgi:DNA modification methylase
MNLGRFEVDNIYNEDCYKAIKEIPDKSVDCIYTDIPYLITHGGSGSSPLSLRINKLAEVDLADIKNGIDFAILEEFIRIMKKINIYIWCSKMQILDIMNFFNKYNCNYEILVWCKDNPTPATNNVWLQDVEYCLYFRESGVKLNDGYELKSKWYSSPINKRDKDKFEHPTIKPIELVKRHLLHTTQPNDIVLDCFMGSGTTCVASKDIGRHYIGFEIEKKWFDIAKDRLNQTDASGQMSLFLR